MRFNLIPPRHTAASAVRQLAEGLASGAIVLRPEQTQPAPETPAAGQPAEPAGDGKGGEG